MPFGIDVLSSGAGTGAGDYSSAGDGGGSIVFGTDVWPEWNYYGQTPTYYTPPNSSPLPVFSSVLGAFRNAGGIIPSSVAALAPQQPMPALPPINPKTLPDIPSAPFPPGGQPAPTAPAPSAPSSGGSSGNYTDYLKCIGKCLVTDPLHMGSCVNNCKDSYYVPPAGGSSAANCQSNILGATFTDPICALNAWWSGNSTRIVIAIIAIVAIIILLPAVFQRSPVQIAKGAIGK